MTTPVPFRGVILEQAAQATLKTRHEVYGDPFTDMDCAAKFTALYREHAADKYCPAHNEAMARVFIKIARIACGVPGHTDSYVDAAAYVAIAAECQHKVDIEDAIQQQLAEAGRLTEHEIAELYYGDKLPPVVEDPINRDTALPRITPRMEVIAALDAMEELRSAVDLGSITIPVPVIIDTDSPLDEYSEERFAVRLGSKIKFLNGQPDVWVVIRIEAAGLTRAEFQHETNGRKLTALIRNVHHVVQY